ncbi:hypothetical protein SAMN05444369_10840 [Capnocytophaga haemolytica]|jgi:hypothetical protein|uniref:Uncharacterized protein n=1 Tax=Capnocytophaga haemolytica TaxID=45243 RepID=A0AAX2GZD4_9FLAO|nr:hypothetical protein [Capnocytophaga haemolytica]SFO06367.1 hypothetical protein SAMN05444369_10840 [Capnocytophaga haemolytica]SNV13610.1 Uncharacterised protein [Capnocytophaga haemolytica]
MTTVQEMEPTTVTRFSFDVAPSEVALVRDFLSKHPFKNVEEKLHHTKKKAGAKKKYADIDAYIQSEEYAAELGKRVAEGRAQMAQGEHYLLETEEDVIDYVNSLCATN